MNAAAPGSDEGEIIPPRPGEAPAAAVLEPFLRERLPLADGPFDLRQFRGGHANLTFLVRFGAQEYVLRRPPLGPVAPGAHDMAREHRVLSALAPLYPLAPRSYLLCEDETVIGSVFVVLERRRGVVFRGDLAPEIRSDPALCRAMGAMIVDALADLHLVDTSRPEIAALGRPEGFVRRQFEGWAGRWEKAARESDPVARAVVAFLERNLPPTSHVALLHNDFKLDNILVSRDDPARAAAVLDWDMGSLGDPMLDLAYMLNYWTEPDDPQEWRQAASMPTWHPGFFDRREAIDRYRDRTGLDVGALVWYRVFAAFKLAVILQQIYVRYLDGQTRDERFRVFPGRIAALLAKASSLARQ